MARGWIFSVIVVAILAAPSTPCWAQMGKVRKPGGSTLASRLSQIKNAFIGSDTPAEEEEAYSAPQRSSQRSNQGNSPQRVARASSPTRVQPGDLLPKGIFFDRASTSEVDVENIELGDEVFHTPAPHANEQAHARKSPSTARKDELQDALDDLLAVEQEHLGESTPIETLPKTSHEDADTRNFDLSQALIDRSKPGSNQPRTESVDELREQFEGLQDDSASVDDVWESDTTQSTSDASHSNSQELAPLRQSPVSVGNRGGLPVAGGETLFNTKQPVISSRVEGPRQILVGREATYRVTLENSSDSTARNVVADVKIPEWAEVVDVISTSGVVERATAEAGTLRWQLQDLSGKSSQSLSVRLIPRSGKPLHLVVEWTQAPVASQAMVEVQEPKLEMKISGPQEVLFNKAQRFQLSLRNPGTGPAENVVIKLIPPGGDEETASSHTVGLLQAGATKEIELELTAREAGDLTMMASATATGNLQAEAVRKVLCRKPELELDWRGPQEKYAGTEAAYYFRVRNAGTANTEPVAMRVKLPEGVKLISASEGYKLDSQGKTISWQIAGIPAGEAEFVQINCQVDRAGTSRFEVSAQTADGELQSAKEIQTNVIAVADLKLTVTDPKGPVPVGETAIYEIKIRNRGTTDAQNVGVVGLFSAGIDPNSVEGAQFSVRDGRVSIHPINTLPAGQEMVLRIRAVATQAGTHVFRAEVSCQDLDIKLAAEETTKFYEDQFRWEDGETAYSQDPAGVGTR